MAQDETRPIIQISDKEAKELWKKAAEDQKRRDNREHALNEPMRKAERTGAIYGFLATIFGFAIYNNYSQIAEKAQKLIQTLQP